MKKKCLLVYLFLICFVSSVLLPVKVVQATTDTSYFEDMKILSKSEVTVKEMQDWARKSKATETFINLAPIYVNLSATHGGVNPAIAYAQSAKETGYGRFGGILDESFFNPCGIKTSQGGEDKDPLAHSKFKSWEEGISAHLDHLALYAGESSYPRKDTFDPRHFASIKGKATTVKDLGGKWAPSETYGLQIASLVKEIYKDVKPSESEGSTPVKPEGPKPSEPVETKPSEPVATKINSVTIDGTKYSTNKSKINTTNFGRPVNLSVDATGSGNFYEFWISDGKTWTPIAPGSAKTSASWTPKEKGYHDIWVGIKASSSSKDYIANFNTFYYIDNVATKINSVTIDGTKYSTNKSQINTTDFGRPINISVDATGSGNFYEFWISDGKTWTPIAPGSAKTSASWTPKEKGYHDIWVGIKASSSSKDYIANFNTFYYIDNVATKINSVTIDGTKYSTNKSQINTTDFGRPINISVDATGSGNFYEFWISDGKTWTPIAPGSAKTSASWTPKEKGYHDIWVGIKASSSSKEYIANFNTFYYISQPSVITKRLIVLDPGHNYGGDDGAYSNIDGITYSERDLNMEVSLKVKANLEKLGFKVILTRQPGDKSKDSLADSLAKRTKIADDAKADLFLSLHHDSGISSATGISTHYSSYRPTIDNEGVAPGVDPGGWQYDDLKIDYTPSAQAIVSKELANNLANGLSSSLGYVNRDAHDHGLYVTRQIGVPSVLLELGFISNKAEVARCSNDYEQEKKAKKIAEILYDYFNK
ncbi:N-acetylmuramoyl-L-alanine amidase [Clostridium algidicarnis]|uniref:N-acetylmuramoyl-L-alanine amidase n=1 Tax=Clostridium algidicarnis TaxID=37659 RepID=A0ABS6C5A9_9CLOT|nr:N-acetylmuramoyl-L-alanine amidase [Clostridium algidicarnis]MBU3220681.1 N-acetylmuramoyl-L-alanine amidase [Clostridium algidicarnis]